MLPLLLRQHQLLRLREGCSEEEEEEGCLEELRSLLLLLLLLLEDCSVLLLREYELISDAEVKWEGMVNE